MSRGKDIYEEKVQLSRAFRAQLEPFFHEIRANAVNVDYCAAELLMRGLDEFSARHRRGVYGTHPDFAAAITYLKQVDVYDQIKGSGREPGLRIRSSSAGALNDFRARYSLTVTAYAARLMLVVGCASMRCQTGNHIAVEAPFAEIFDNVIELAQMNVQIEDVA